MRRYEKMGKLLTPSELGEYAGLLKGTTDKEGS